MIWLSRPTANAVGCLATRTKSANSRSTPIVNMMKASTAGRTHPVMADSMEAESADAAVTDGRRTRQAMPRMVRTSHNGNMGLKSLRVHGRKRYGTTRSEQRDGVVEGPSGWRPDPPWS